jgi:hypothetical protein
LRATRRAAIRSNDRERVALRTTSARSDARQAGEDNLRPPDEAPHFERSRAA